MTKKPKKKVSLFDTGGKSQTNPKCGVRVSNSEAGIVAPKQEATLRLRTSVQKETNLPYKRLATRTRITKRNYSREYRPSQNKTEEILIIIIIISAPIIMIRTRSQMENKPHEKVFQEGRRTKRAHWLTSLRTLHKDETRKNCQNS